MVRINGEYADRKAIQDAGFREMKRQRIMTLAAIFVIAGIFILLNLKGSSQISVQVNRDAVGVAGPDTTSFVPLKEITEIALADHYEIGTAVSAQNRAGVYEGTYENREYGVYTACISSRCSRAIVIRYKEGTFVFSGLSDKDTENIYQQIIKEMGRS